MKAHVDEQAITVSVGQFIRELRNGKKRPSMLSILKKNGVNSSMRAQSLINRMIENKIIVKHRDNSYSLTRQNYDMNEVMNVLIHVPRKKPVRKNRVKETAIVVVEQETINPLDHFDPQDLVDYLRSKGWVIDAYRDVTVRQTL